MVFKIIIVSKAFEYIEPQLMYFIIFVSYNGNSPAFQKKEKTINSESVCFRFGGWWSWWIGLKIKNEYMDENITKIWIQIVIFVSKLLQVIKNAFKTGGIQPFW